MKVKILLTLMQTFLSITLNAQDYNVIILNSATL